MKLCKIIIGALLLVEFQTFTMDHNDGQNIIDVVKKHSVLAIGLAATGVVLYSLHRRNNLEREEGQKSFNKLYDKAAVTARLLVDYPQVIREIKTEASKESAISQEQLALFDDVIKQKDFETAEYEQQEMQKQYKKDLYKTARAAETKQAALLIIDEHKKQHASIDVSKVKKAIKNLPNW